MGGRVSGLGTKGAAWPAKCSSRRLGARRLQAIYEPPREEQRHSLQLPMHFPVPAREEQRQEVRNAERNQDGLRQEYTHEAQVERFL
jgi:hypothetical protein